MNISIRWLHNTVGRLKKTKKKLWFWDTCGKTRIMQDKILIMKISNLFKYIFKLNNNTWQNLYYTHHQSLTNIFPPAFGSLIDFWKSLVDMGSDTDFAMYYFWFIKMYMNPLAVFIVQVPKLSSDHLALDFCYELFWAAFGFCQNLSVCMQLN